MLSDPGLPLLCLLDNILQALGLSIPHCILACGKVHLYLIGSAGAACPTHQRINLRSFRLGELKNPLPRTGFTGLHGGPGRTVDFCDHWLPHSLPDSAHEINHLGFRLQAHVVMALCSCLWRRMADPVVAIGKLQNSTDGSADSGMRSMVPTHGCSSSGTPHGDISESCLRPALTCRANHQEPHQPVGHAPCPTRRQSLRSPPSGSVTFHSSRSETSKYPAITRGCVVKTVHGKTDRCDCRDQTRRPGSTALPHNPEYASGDSGHLQEEPHDLPDHHQLRDEKQTAHASGCPSLPICRWQSCTDTRMTGQLGL